MPPNRPADPIAQRVARRVREARAWTWFCWAAVVAAGLAGLVYGFAFGVQLGGMPLGALLAVIGALISSTAVDATLDQLAGWWRARASRR